MAQGPAGVWKSPWEWSYTAVDPYAGGGEMYAPRYGSFGAAVRRNYRTRGIEGSVAKLWQVSEEQTGVRLDIEAAKP